MIADFYLWIFRKFFQIVFGIFFGKIRGVYRIFCWTYIGVRKIISFLKKKISKKEEIKDFKTVDKLNKYNQENTVVRG